MTREIFVFGSNLAGRHGKGSALEALQKHGAKYGQGVGLQGNSFAIPTKGFSPYPGAPMPILSLNEIHFYIIAFIDFAQRHPELTFRCVAIGCGRAGYSPREIAPLFKGAPENVLLPAEFLAILRSDLKTSAPDIRRG